MGASYRRQQEIEAADRRAQVLRRLKWWADGATAARIAASIGWLESAAITELSKLLADKIVDRVGNLWRLVTVPKRPPPRPPPPKRRVEQL